MPRDYSFIQIRSLKLPKLLSINVPVPDKCQLWGEGNFEKETVNNTSIKLLQALWQCSSTYKKK